MIHHPPGTYRVGWTMKGNESVVVIRCPFCDNRSTIPVPRPQVKDHHRVLVFRCPICNIEDTYAPQT